MCSSESRTVWRKLFFFSLSVVQRCSDVDKTHTWQCIRLHRWRFAIFPPHCLSHLPVSKQSCVYSLHVIPSPLLLLSLFFLLPFFSFLSLFDCLYSCLYSTSDCTALRVCASSRRPQFGNFPHTCIYILSHTQKFMSLFTVCFAFEQGVRLSNEREEGTFFMS